MKYNAKQLKDDEYPQVKFYAVFTGKKYAIDLHNYVVSGRDNNGVIIEAEKGGLFHINANTQAIRKATYEEGADEHTVGWR